MGKLCLNLGILIGLCIAPMWAWADTKIRLDLVPDQAPFHLASTTSVLIDSEKQEADWDERLQLTDLIALPSTVFSPVTTPEIGFGWNSAIIYARTLLRNPTDEDQTWVLATNQSPWGKRSVYLVIDEQPLPADPFLKFPDDKPWNNSDRLLHAQFDMPAGATATLYTTYANAASSAPLSIEVPQNYNNRRMLAELNIYILIGLVFGVTILTVSLLGILHPKASFFYAAYLVCATMHICYVVNLFAFLPILSDFVYPVMRFWWAALSLFAYLMFQRAFFAKDPRIGDVLPRILLFVAIIHLLFVVAHDFFGQPYVYVIVWSSVCVLIIAANGIIAINKRITGRWFFSAGCLVLTAMVIPLMLSDFLTGYYTFETASFVTLYGLTFEAIALSCAMFARVREIRMEKEQALVAELKSTRETLSMTQKMAAAAHDLQQPLTSLKLAIKQDKKENKTLGGAIDYLDDIVRSQLVDHSADLAGREMELADVNVILDNLGPMFAAEATKKGLRFKLVPCNQQTTGNAFAMMRIVANLVSNAIRNTETGGVLVGCRTRNGQPCIEIYDTGPGMDPEDFAVLKAARSRKGAYDGQGLGLSIVDQLCRENGFELGMTSVIGKGTRIQLYLPTA